MHTKCRKKCSCEICEHFQGEENMVVTNKDLSSGLCEHKSTITGGVCCNDGYRVAESFRDLRLGYEEDDYIIVNNKLRYKADVE